MVVLLGADLVKLCRGEGEAVDEWWMGSCHSARDCALHVRTVRIL